MLASLLVLALRASASGVTFAVAPQSACNDSIADAPGRIASLLRAARDYSLPELRGLAGVDPSHLRVLTRTTDAEICRTLRRRVSDRREPDRITGRPWLVQVFEADGYYFVVVSRDRRDIERDTGRARVVIGERGSPTLYVFDRNLNQVTATRA